MGDLEFMLFPLPINIKAKYLVGIYILIDIAVLLKGGDVRAQDKARGLDDLADAGEDLLPQRGERGVGVEEGDWHRTTG